ncbi:MAG: squalene/phytoene synthase family protein [Myxococcaceae bacterium]
MTFPLDDLLEKTSRTFALAIPLLPTPAREAVGLAYLLFRVADTFEDAARWPREARLDALEQLAEVLELEGPEQHRAASVLVRRAAERPPVDHEGYLELLGALPGLLEEVARLPEPVRAVVLRHTLRTTEGMARVVTRTDERGNLALATRAELRDYCYVVAGIVGELLTELFLVLTPSLSDQGAALRAEMVAFGEGLQLVNILKDADGDAVEGRVFLPAAMPRADVFALARADLEAGERYVSALQRGGAPEGYLAFTGLSLALAWRAIDGLERHGAGHKVSRDDVGRIFESLQGVLERGEPVSPRVIAGPPLPLGRGLG